jgi:hypothetical protein
MVEYKRKLAFTFRTTQAENVSGEKLLDEDNLVFNQRLADGSVEAVGNRFAQAEAAYFCTQRTCHRTDI